ncbi:MAG: hypothetical protein KDK78_06070 [Chlamydiia bacterium]|nr:hypothetical protein [Chlamydiia bacterium]
MPSNPKERQDALPVDARDERVECLAQRRVHDALVEQAHEHPRFSAEKTEPGVLHCGAGHAEEARQEVLNERNGSRLLGINPP